MASSTIHKLGTPIYKAEVPLAGVAVSSEYGGTYYTKLASVVGSGYSIIGFAWKSSVSGWSPWIDAAPNGRDLFLRSTKDYTFPNDSPQILIVYYCRNTDIT